MKSSLGVALWEIKLNLCDAVGDDRGDDGDVHGIDDDDKQDKLQLGKDMKRRK